MRLALALLVVACCASGCSHTVRVAPDTFRAALNRRAAEREAMVTLARGAHVRARMLRMEADSATWFDPRTGALRRAASADVVAVRFASRARGAGEGALLGAAAGFTALALAGASWWVSEEDRQPFQEAAPTIGLFGLIGVPGGVVGGTFIGAVRGSEVGYRVRQ